jgi:membrane protease YdiL (CAAX protease family)
MLLCSMRGDGCGTVVLVAALLSSVVGCGPALPRARTSELEPTLERERRSFERVASGRSCAELGLLFPGVSQFCLGKPAEGAALSGLAAAEIGTIVAVGVIRDDGLEGLEHPAAGVPALGLQNLWLYSYADAIFERQRAYQLRFVPMDTLGELAIAPFHPKVLSQLDVWLGILATVPAGIGASLLIDGNFEAGDAGGDPNLFGRTFDSSVGYPLAGAVGMGLFSHVAIGEESVFRGLIQSQMARETSEVSGWIAASLAFGAAHAPNVLVVPSDERARYLIAGVPFLTIVGGYFGLSYRWHDYSLAAPVALHFWYDVLLSAVFFTLDPQNSPISARVAIPF